MKFDSFLCVFVIVFSYWNSYLDLYLLLTGKTFGPLHFSRQDLGVLTIMRGRDHGLADYNTVRKTLKLGEIKSWTDLNPDLPDSVRTIFLL